MLCWAGLALVTTLVGLAFTSWIVPIDRFESADERLVSWFAGHRTPFWNDASFIGSQIAGGYLIPALVATVVIVAVLRKRWLVAGFVLSTILIESGTYRATVFFVNRDRPNVDRLESLPVDASYPSGHTAAALALYSGFALLLTSRMTTTWLKVLVWMGALAVPPIVACSRMYRGMHHPTDTIAGLLMGISALLLALLLARVTDVVTRRRAEACRREQCCGRGGRTCGQVHRGRPARASTRARATGGLGADLARGAEEPKGAEAGRARARRWRGDRLRLGRGRDGAEVRRRARGIEAALAIIPAGTANLFASNLGIPQDIEQAVHIGLHGNRRGSTSAG